MLRVYRFLALLVGIAALAASGPSLAQRAQGYVQEASGNVTGFVGSGQAARVERGQTLPNNATVTTGPGSYAVLKFEDGTAVLLKENTSFQVQSYTYNARAPENANAIFNLLRGGLRMVTGLVTSRNRESLKVGTPLATIGIRGTEFVAELVNPLFLQVVAGTISVTNAAGTVLLTVGQVGAVASASTLGGLVPMSQVPPGVFQMPNIPLTPAPGAVPSGSVIGGGGVAGGVGVGTAVAIGAAAAAAVVISTENQQTTTHHSK